MKDKLTIIIPSKNEKENIYECVGFIAKQSGIAGTKVIIADCSDDVESLKWLNQTIKDFKYSLDIEIIEGGYPAYGRLAGSYLCKTDYILFLDADIMLFDKFILGKCLTHNSDLVTVPFHTEKEWNWVFRMFDIFQQLSNLLGTPFAVGGFQFWKTEAYWKTDGYKYDHLFAEDYWISSKAKKMKIQKTKEVWTSARRFKNKGIVWMFRIMILSYINRNNEEFFKKHHNYWN